MSITFRKLFASGVHLSVTLGCPRKVSVIAERKGGFGMSWMRIRVVATRPVSSIHT
jgi:hypothetical protein